MQNVSSPYGRDNAGQLSGGRPLRARDLRAPGRQPEDKVDPSLDAVARSTKQHAGFRIEQFGDGSADKALSKAFEDDFRKAEVTSLPITLVILILAFGALLAAFVPLLLAITAVAAAIGLIGPISQIWPVDEAISSVVLLIGLAVGVDYSMFYLRREREERARGRSEEAALEAAAATSGRAVLVSGITVIAAMAGMYFGGAATFLSFATGTILVVAIAVIGSLTVLPAILSKLGDRVNKGRVPFMRPGAAHRRGARVGLGARPRAAAPARLAARGRLGAGGARDPGAPHPHRRTRAWTACRARSRSCRPTTACRPPSRARPSARTSWSRAEPRRGRGARGGAGDAPGRARVGPVPGAGHGRRDPRRQVAVVEVPLAGTGTDERSMDAVETLREDVVPDVFGGVSSGEVVGVAGFTAGSVDFNDLMASRIWYVFAFVFAMAFLLLLVTFRSIVIPIKAILLNVLSVAGGARDRHLGVPGRQPREPCSASTPPGRSPRGSRSCCS